MSTTCTHVSAVLELKHDLQLPTKDHKKALLNFLSKYVFWEQSDNHMLSINWTNTPVRYEMVPCCYKRHEKSKVNGILPLYK